MSPAHHGGKRRLPRRLPAGAITGHPPRGGKGEHRYTRRAGALAKRLRKTPTFTEKLLWAELRKLPLHVRRQAPIGRYVADFVIHAARLVVDVDGPRHEEPDDRLHDAQRDAWLAAEGFRTARFTDREVIGDAAGVAVRVLDLARPVPDVYPA